MFLRSLLLCPLFLILVSSLCGEEIKTYEITGVAAGDTLNIRSGPGLNFQVVGRLPNGEGGIQIRGEVVMNGNDEWVPIAFQGGKGWTRSKYLLAASGTAVPPAAEKPSATAPSLEDATVFQMMADHYFDQHEKKAALSRTFLGKIHADQFWRNGKESKSIPEGFEAGEMFANELRMSGRTFPLQLIAEGSKNGQPAMMAFAGEQSFFAVKFPNGILWTFKNEKGENTVYDAFETPGEKPARVTLSATPPQIDVPHELLGVFKTYTSLHQCRNRDQAVAVAPFVGKIYGSRVVKKADSLDDEARDETLKPGPVGEVLPDAFVDAKGHRRPFAAVAVNPTKNPPMLIAVTSEEVISGTKTAEGIEWEIVDASGAELEILDSTPEARRRR